MTSKIKPLRHRAGAVCRHGSQVLLVQMRDPLTGFEFLVPPGGGIEAGETASDAAVREVREETGYRVKLSHSEPLRSKYDFEWNGQLIACETEFFLCELDEPYRDPSDIREAEYIKAIVWVEVDKLSSTLAFHEEIHRAVRETLKLT